MVEIEFDYKQEKLKIQVNLEDKFENAIQKLKFKIKKENEDLCFLSKGKNVNKDEIIQNIMNESEKQSKTIKILVFDLDTPIPENTNMVKSKDIICPECKESCLIEIKNNRIRLYDCKNGHEKKN